MQMHKGGKKAGGYGARQTWEEAIKAPGSGQMIHLKDLMLKYNFQDLVPDQSLLTLPGNRYDHQVALKGKNVILVYTYNGRNISLNKASIPGENLKYTWYSPRDGSYSGSFEVKKADLRELDPPGEQKNGNDWVLILEII